jgi:uncharacterized protein
MRRITVRTSPVHGRGVFALANLTPGTLLLEYKGLHLSWKEAQRAHARSSPEDGHTFLFGLDDGSVIESGQELFIDYRLTVDGRRTAAVKQLYACRCLATACRGTMLSRSR